MATSNKTAGTKKAAAPRDPSKKSIENLSAQVEALNERLALLEKYFAEGLIFQKLRQLENQIRKVEDQASELTQKGEKAITGLTTGFKKAWSDLRKGQKDAAQAMNSTEH